MTAKQLTRQSCGSVTQLSLLLHLATQPHTPHTHCTPTAHLMPPAAAMWLSLIIIMSYRPMRCGVPPPSATAHLSSNRRPGTVLRVSWTLLVGYCLGGSQQGVDKEASVSLRRSERGVSVRHVNKWERTSKSASAWLFAAAKALRRPHWQMPHTAVTTHWPPLSSPPRLAHSLCLVARCCCQHCCCCCCDAAHALHEVEAYALSNQDGARTAGDSAKLLALVNTVAICRHVGGGACGCAWVKQHGRE